MNNTVVRSLSGIVFLIIMIGSLLWNPIIFAFLMIFCIVVMMHEYLTISMGQNYPLAKMLSMITGVSAFITMFLNAGYGFSSNILFLNVVPLVAIIISLLYSKHKEDSYIKHSYLLSSLVYIVLPFSLTNYLVFNNLSEYSATTLLAFFILLWASDVGAYVFGITFGQKNGHKLFPSISPKKSWEGFFGGLISAVIAGCILRYYDILEFSLLHSIAISLIINLFGVLGDLVESQFKRNFGVKDSGHIMPGHGGLLDRFDGALISFPVAIAYLKIFSLI